VRKRWGNNRAVAADDVRLDPGELTADDH